MLLENWVQIFLSNLLGGRSSGLQEAGRETFDKDGSSTIFSHVFSPGRGVHASREGST